LRPELLGRPVRASAAQWRRCSPPA
jgi:hypothetical protein